MRFVTVNLSSVQREMKRERTAAARLALDADESAMAAHDMVDDRQPETGALRTRAGIGLDAIELPEDLALEPRRDADASVGDAHDAITVFGIDRDRDLPVLRRV